MKRSFTILIHEDAMDDIQEAISYYNLQRAGLGRRFHGQVKRTFRELALRPFYQIRYDNVRCRLVKKFPFLVHFIVDESTRTISIYRLWHTSRNY